MEDIRKDLRDKGKALGIKITEGQAEQFQTYIWSCCWSGTRR